jgi:uncharacterized protein (DUF2235 family)
MADSARNLIVLSDGTGNSASKAFKTNVWRLYEAIDFMDGSQVAVFGDGVGTSSVKVLRVLGLALGIGVKRNVLNLYKFLCLNYNPGDNDRPADLIWAFGFSRGAYTIRVLAALICEQGLVTSNSEEELNRNALAAYRAFRKTAFATTWRRFWVKGGRNLRDWLVDRWSWITNVRPRPYEAVEKHKVNIHFIGVWDTVDAYGLPVEELTIAVDKLVWPMRFTDTALLPKVDHARHALSLDDERRTFFPVLWDELAEGTQIDRDRLQQVWFPGAHADVGGGYADDGLSFVPLCWMIDEAKKKGLRFAPCIVENFIALAAPTGRIYDSRSGFGALWRYQPRDVADQMNRPDRDKPRSDGADKITPVVHWSVITRMIYGNDGYAPISVPAKVDVLPPYGDPVPFESEAVAKALADAEAVIQRLADATPSEPLSDADKRAALEKRQFLTDMQTLVTKVKPSETNSTDLFKLVVLDTVWWRRVVYFVSLALVVIAGLFPLLAKYLRLEGVTEDLNIRMAGLVGSTLGLIKGFLPGFAEPWVAAVVRYPAQAAIVPIAPWTRQSSNQLDIIVQHQREPGGCRTKLRRPKLKSIFGN